MEKVKSLDIFDTLVSRDVYKPSDLFYFLGKDLQRVNLINIDALEFQRLRINAERLARENSKYEEVTLDEIYETLSKILNLTKVKRIKFQ